MLCPRCNLDNPEIHKFCAGCGYEFASDIPAPVQMLIAREVATKTKEALATGLHDRTLVETDIAQAVTKRLKWVSRRFLGLVAVSTVLAVGVVVYQSARLRTDMQELRTALTLAETDLRAAEVQIRAAAMHASGVDHGMDVDPQRATNGSGAAVRVMADEPPAEYGSNVASRDPDMPPRMTDDMANVTLLAAVDSAPMSDHESTADDLASVTEQMNAFADHLRMAGFEMSDAPLKVSLFTELTQDGSGDKRAPEIRFQNELLSVQIERMDIDDPSVVMAALAAHVFAQEIDPIVRPDATFLVLRNAMADYFVSSHLAEPPDTPAAALAGVPLVLGAVEYAQRFSDLDLNMPNVLPEAQRVTTALLWDLRDMIGPEEIEKVLSAIWRQNARAMVNDRRPIDRFSVLLMNALRVNPDANVRADLVELWTRRGFPI